MSETPEPEQTDSPSPARAGRPNRSPPPGFRIGLIFHGIGTPARSLPPGEAPYWLDIALFETILDRIVAAPLREAFQLSFDDGNASDHLLALPRLLDRGLVADFFVLSGRIGQPGSLDRAQVLALQAAGMRIGSHGVGHNDLRRLPDADLHRELESSRLALEALCGRPVTALGIPFGSYDRRVLRAAKAAGYVEVHSSDRGRSDPAHFLRPRTSLRGDMSMAEIGAVLSGRLGPMSWMRRAVGMARRQWLGPRSR